MKQEENNEKTEKKFISLLSIYNLIYEKLLIIYQTLHLNTSLK